MVRRIDYKMKPMKILFIPLLVGLSAMALLTGCLDLHLEGGKKSSSTNTDEHPTVGQATTAPTIGQQLIDLQKAREAGAITDQEYQDEKVRLLETK